MNILVKYHKTILVTATIIFLSLVNVQKITPDDLPLFKNFDKVVHFLMYFGITSIFLLESYYAGTKINYKISIRLDLFPLFLGGSMEILQSLLTPNRSGDWIDLLFNMTGIAVASIVFHRVKDNVLIKKLVSFPFRVNSMEKIR